MKISKKNLEINRRRARFRKFSFLQPGEIIYHHGNIERLLGRGCMSLMEVMEQRKREFNDLQEIKS